MNPDLSAKLDEAAKRAKSRDDKAEAIILTTFYLTLGWGRFGSPGLSLPTSSANRFEIGFQFGPERLSSSFLFSIRMRHKINSSKRLVVDYCSHGIRNECTFLPVRLCRFILLCRWGTNVRAAAHFFGQLAYIVYVRYNPFRAVKIPVKRVFDPGHG